MRVATAVNCIDGRVQLPVTKFLRRRFGARVVDMVTEPGPARVLAEQRDVAAVDGIVRGVRASVQYHESRLIAVAAHADCAATPLDRDDQVGHVRLAAADLERRFPEARIVGLWVDRRGKVEVVTTASRDE